MRTTDELFAAVKDKAGQRERSLRKRNVRIASVSAAAAGLALVAGLCLAMPGVMERLAGGAYVYVGSAASIFTGSSVLGFIVVGVLAFALGVCVTMLCYMLRRHNERDKGNGHG